MADEDILSGDFTFGGSTPEPVILTVNGQKFRCRAFVSGPRITQLSAGLLARGDAAQARAITSFMERVMSETCATCGGAGNVGEPVVEDGPSPVCQTCFGSGEDRSEYERFLEFADDPQNGIDQVAYGRIAAFLIGRYSGNRPT